MYSGRIVRGNDLITVVPMLYSRGMRHARNPVPILVSILLLSTAASCGPKAGELQAKHPWDPEYAQYFDDSLDFTMNPDSLSGQWMFSYKLELESRISLADYVLAVRVQSINLKVDAAGKQAKNLNLVVEKDVKGEFPTESLVLTVTDDTPGFDSFNEDDARLTDKIFVAYLRLYETEDKSVAIHWHLSPLSEGLKDGIDEILKVKEEKKAEEKGTTYTIEHESGSQETDEPEKGSPEK